MISIDNKAKHEWERDNFMKWIKSEVQLPNDKGWIEKKNQLKKEYKIWLESACRDSVVRSK